MEWGARLPSAPSRTYHHVLTFLRLFIAAEVADAWNKFGGVGAMLADLSRISELSVAQNMETASRDEEALSAARSHVARQRGSVHGIRDEPVSFYRERLAQCVRD